MNNIYEILFPKLQIQMVGNNRISIFITLNDLIGVIAETKGISYEEEIKLFDDFKAKNSNIKDLNVNEFDEYEEIKD